ncbi:MAG TPA: hypothetical protein VH987_08370 [Candidatus Limnocylindria bacterium]
MSDPRPPDDGSSWPERDLDRADQPGSGWSSDDPYRYEPAPRWEPQPFEPLEEAAPWQPPRFDDEPDEDVEVAEPPFGEPDFEPMQRPDLSAFLPEPEVAADASEPEPMAEPIPEPDTAEAEDLGETPAPEPEFEQEPVSASMPEPTPLPDPEPDPEPEQEPEPEFEREPVSASMPEPTPLPEPEPEPEPEPGPPHIPDAVLAAGAASLAEPRIPPVAAVEPPIAQSEPVTAFDAASDAWDPKVHGNRRRPTTAEQAVPWLIGIILALAGMVIVLLALIFTSPNGLMAADPSASPTANSAASGSEVPSPSGPIGGPGPVDSGEPSPAPQETPVATPTEPPTYGPLEMVYLGRQSAVAPVYLLRRDFSKRREAEVMAQADQGVEKFAWAPDGTVGVALISERAVALRPGRPARELLDNVSAVTFGWDAETVYAVRITKDGGNDRARVLQIDFRSREVQSLATVTYPTPVIGPDAPLREAQFIDDGGVVRLVAMADGHLNLWILGAPDVYQIDPADGAVARVTRQPNLWSPDGTQRIELREDGGTTRIQVRDRGDRVLSATLVTGLVSHVRWAGTSNEIVFTLGVVSAGGGVRQDLYVWDLADRGDPLPLTSSGTAFGAEWRGVMPNWAP